MGDKPIDADAPATAVTLPLDAGTVTARPPVLEQRPYEVSAPHGATRQDEYYWLRDDERANPDMLAYLEAENDYADAVMAPLADSEAALYEELVGRIKQDDSSVPYKYKDYWYYTRFEEGQEYPVHARRKGNMDAPEEVMLDVNQLADGHDFYQIGNWKVSPDQTLLAYVEDTVGRRQFTLRVRDLGSDETLPVQVPGVSTSLAWAADNKTLFYVVNDAGNAPDAMGQVPHAGQPARQRPGRLRGTGRQFLYGFEHHALGEIYLHQSRQHRIERVALYRDRGAGRVSRIRAARTRLRILGGPPRLSLGDPHQLECPEFQTDGSRR